MNDFQAATLQEWRKIEEIVAKLINWSMLENKVHNLKSPKYWRSCPQGQYSPGDISLQSKAFAEKFYFTTRIE